MYNVTLRYIYATTIAIKKTISIKHSECVSVVLLIQHAKGMLHIILTSVACMTLPYFSSLSNNDTIFGKKLLNIKHVF
jgi:hypothetical protein